MAPTGPVDPRTPTPRTARAPRALPRTPPDCPVCPGPRHLWKDTTDLHRGPRDWVWWCSGCRQRFEPAEEHRRMYAGRWGRG
ncbi:hypothetical protein [Streptomyces sp. MST-110588]|uniref:hypothetical protein n=1 Tax=Streptomyces sp. MST-110588 TaxID=2833628 RepID=UPI001F5CAC10|nr:hypothetical protein [Streptomyces sp. MST-110588]UNO40400.1 hypothetical protein KGS77_13465 [Streptomyces sp. MST-110588]